MWIQRTHEQIVKWHVATEKQASSTARTVAGVVWGLSSVLAAAGLAVSLRAGIAVGQPVRGSFIARLPIALLMAFPFALFVYWRVRPTELSKLRKRSICIRCDRAFDGGGEGSICGCGGTLVPASSVVWSEP